MVKPAIQPVQDANKPAHQASNTQPAGQTPMLGRLLTAQRAIGPRSSLFSHTIPPFYACYLLKSIQTPQTNFIYIGSTPSPPRRIRQHNGELTAGARKTARKRPLVMQMIVYGFPSRLAALQFEWAWQHPHKSRHLRDETGNLFGSRKSYLMHKNIEIVQGMIARYPFTSWPLHVKLFTEEAVKFWEAAARKSKTPMPPGFMYSVELEGVDGKSGLVGSGRVGPMRADDDDFAAAIMIKHEALVASGKTPSCSICNEPLHTYATEPLHSTLCPTTGCTTTSHLTCLSRQFLTEQPDTPGLVPRGGHCKGCGEYTLWGDVVRGCYRRLPPRDTEQHPDVETDEMYESDEEEDDMLLKPKARKSSPVKKTRKRRACSLTTKKGKAKALGDDSLGTSSSGETFDFDNISSSSEDGNVPVTPKRRLGRSRKVDATMTTTPVPFLLPTDSSMTRTRLAKTTARVNILREASPTIQPLGSPIKLGNDIEVVDLSNVASSSELESPATPKRKRGKPPKNTAQPTSEQPSPSKKRHVLDTVSSTEVGGLDSSNVVSNSEGVGATVVETEPKKRGPGRPRKSRGTTAASSPLLSRASTKSRSHRLSPVANDSPPLSRLYHQHLASTSSNIPRAPSHPRHGRNVHFLPRSPEHEPSHAAAPGSFDIESPGSFIWDQERYHDQGNDTGGFQEDCGSDSGVMHYSPPRTPDRADRREAYRPSTPPSTTGGLTRAMAGLSTAGGTPSKVSSSRQKSSIPSIWSKGSIPVIEISD